MHKNQMPSKENELEIVRIVRAVEAQRCFQDVAFHYGLEAV